MNIKVKILVGTNKTFLLKKKWLIDVCGGRGQQLGVGYNNWEWGRGAV